MDEAIERLIAAVETSGYKRVRIAADARMSPAKLSKILTRKQVPTVPDFIDIARAMRLDPARLFTDHELIVELESVRAAHAASREVQAMSERLTELLANLLPEPQASRVPVTALRKPVPSREATPVRAAANPNAELVIELETTRKRIPRSAWNRGARMIARAVGDSMDGGIDPIRNDELVYLKPTRSARNAVNRIVLLRREDGLYLKKFEMSGRTIRLVSENGDPIELDVQAESLQIYGYVVGHGAE